MSQRVSSLARSSRKRENLGSIVYRWISLHCRRHLCITTVWRIEFFQLCLYGRVAGLKQNNTWGQFSAMYRVHCTSVQLLVYPGADNVSRVGTLSVNMGVKKLQHDSTRGFFPKKSIGELINDDGTA